MPDVHNSNGSHVNGNDKTQTFTPSEPPRVAPDSLQKSPSTTPTRESHKAKAIRKSHAKKVLAEQDANRARERKFKIKETEFLCIPKFRNRLPDIPFEPKFLEFPFPADRLTRYNPTALEEQYRLKLNPEPDLGLPLDMVDMEKFLIPSAPPPLPQDDANLFAEEKATTKERKVRPHVTWLRRTEYLANDLYEQVHRFQAGKPGETEDSEQMNGLACINTKESIEESFSAVSTDSFDLTNPTDGTLKVEEILPVFPDANLFANRYQLAYFDLDPVRDLAASGEDANERMAKSIIRNVDYADSNSVVKTLFGSLIVPDAVQEDPEVESLQFLRDYQFETKELRQGQFIFLKKPDHNEISLCNIEQRIELKKKKDRSAPDRIRGALVTRTEYNEEEAAIRLKVLQDAGGRLPVDDHEPHYKKQKVDEEEVKEDGNGEREEVKKDDSPPSSPKASTAHSESESGSDSDSSASGSESSSASGSDSKRSDSDDD